MMIGLALVTTALAAVIFGLLPAVPGVPTILCRCFPLQEEMPTPHLPLQFSITGRSSSLI